jgi:hydroxymethylglutaryl-CoA lyase
MNRKNINMSLQQAVLVCGDVIRRAKSDGLFARLYLAAAFECGFEGPTPPSVVFDLLEKMAAAGPDEFAIADTTGAANPRQVRHIFDTVVEAYGTTRISAHFHDTQGLASALTLTALECGIRRFDSSVAGLGGCPFVPGASGNAATEDLVFLFHELGFDTGVDFDKLIEAVDTVQDMLPEAPGGRILRWCRGRSAYNASSKPDDGLGLSR